MGYFDDAMEAKNNEEVLEHHGILGQKWGVRRFQNKDGSLTPRGKSRYGEESDVSKKLNSARADKKAANKEYNKSFNKAYNKSSNPINHLTKKGRKEMDNAWDDASKKADNYISKNNSYKEAKKAFKDEYKKNLQDVRENATLKDKVIYNDATRRRAAKLMTKYKDMDYNKVTEAAKSEAKRNTAIALAAYGAITLASIGISKSSRSSNSYVSVLDDVFVSGGKKGSIPPLPSGSKSKSSSKSFDEVFGSKKK